MQSFATDRLFVKWKGLKKQLLNIKMTQTDWTKRRVSRVEIYIKITGLTVLSSYASSYDKTVYFNSIVIENVMLDSQDSWSRIVFEPSLSWLTCFETGKIKPVLFCENYNILGCDILP